MYVYNHHHITHENKKQGTTNKRNQKQISEVYSCKCPLTEIMQSNMTYFVQLGAAGSSIDVVTF